MSDPEDTLVQDFQTLQKVRRTYQDGLYAEGDFRYQGNDLLVHWEQGGFTVYGSTEDDMTEVARVFESRFPFDRFYVSENGTDFEEVTPYSYTLDWDFEAVKGIGEMFGFVATSEDIGDLGRENAFWVFSDEESFRQVAASSRAVHDVFPELMGLGREHEVLLEDATDFAMSSRDIIEGR